MHEHGTVTEHVALPQVPSLPLTCMTPPHPLPDAPAATCPPGVCSAEKRSCSGNGQARESLCLSPLSPGVIQRYLSTDSIQLPVLRSCVPNLLK